MLAAVALPVFDGAREATRSGAAQQALAASVLLAASRAASGGRKSSSAPACRRRAVAGSTGIADGSPSPTPTAIASTTPGNRCCSTSAPLGGTVRLRSTIGRTRLVFQPNGGSAGTNMTFTLCDGRGTSHATALVLNNTGRLRSATPDAGAARACVDAQ